MRGLTHNHLLLRRYSENFWVVMYYITWNVKVTEKEPQESYPLIDITLKRTEIFYLLSKQFWKFLKQISNVRFMLSVIMDERDRVAAL